MGGVVNVRNSLQSCVVGLYRVRSGPREVLYAG